MPSPIHDILQQNKGLAVPGVYDALGAKLAEQAGFPLIVVSGYGVSATQLGLPDFGYLTQTEMAMAAKRICGAVRIPVLVDGDTGYGNALNVIRTVRELLAAGAAGMFLEDQVWPKRCGHMKGKRVISVGEQVQKLRAAVDARNGRDFFLIARTDARQVEGLDAAIDRCHRYHEAGADALFLEAPRSPEELARIGRELPHPLVANMVEGGETPIHTRAELAELGFAMVLYPLSGLYAGAKAVRDILAVIQSHGTTESPENRLLTFSQFHQILDLDGHYAMDEHYRASDES